MLLSVTRAAARMTCAPGHSASSAMRTVSLRSPTTKRNSPRGISGPPVALGPPVNLTASIRVSVGCRNMTVWYPQFTTSPTKIPRYGRDAVGVYQASGMAEKVSSSPRNGAMPNRNSRRSWKRSVLASSRDDGWLGSPLRPPHRQRSTSEGTQRGGHTPALPGGAAGGSGDTRKILVVRVPPWLYSWIWPVWGSGCTSGPRVMTGSRQRHTLIVGVKIRTDGSRDQYDMFEWMWGVRIDRSAMVLLVGSKVDATRCPLEDRSDHQSRGRSHMCSCSVATRSRCG